MHIGFFFSLIQFPLASEISKPIHTATHIHKNLILLFIAFNIYLCLSPQGHPKWLASLSSVFSSQEPCKIS